MTDKTEVDVSVVIRLNIFNEENDVAFYLSKEELVTLMNKLDKALRAQETANTDLESFTR